MNNLEYGQLLDKFDTRKKYLQEIENIIDKQTWEEVQQKNTKKAYENYLHIYYNGIYSNEAKIKIDEFIRLKKEKELEKIRLEKIRLKKEEEKSIKEKHQQIYTYLDKNKIFFNSFPKLSNELNGYLVVKDLYRLSHIISLIEEKKVLFKEFNTIINKLIGLGVSKKEVLSFIKLSTFKTLSKDFKFYSNLINQIPTQELYEWKPIDESGKSVNPWTLNKSKAWVDRKTNRTIIVLPREINYEQAVSIIIDLNKVNFAGKNRWSLLTLDEINYLLTKKFLDFIGLNSVNRVWIEYSNISGMASSFNLLNNIREITSSTKDMCSVVLISK